MEVGLVETIMAVVTLHPNKVSGGAPVFHVDDEEELEKVATYLAKAVKGMIHDLETGTYIVVKH